jgi:hypothetical protein
MTVPADKAAQKAADRAAAETVIASLTARAERKLKKSAKSAKKAKKFVKAARIVEKLGGSDENLHHLAVVLTDLEAARDKFNEKSAKQAAKAEKLQKTVGKLRKAFKIAPPAAALPPGPRQIVFAVDMGGSTLRRLMPDINAASDAAERHVVAAGRRAVPHLGYFSRDSWMQLNVAGLVPGNDAEFKTLLRDALRMPFFAEPGIDSLVRQLDNGQSAYHQNAAARHFVLICENAVIGHEDALLGVLAKNPSVTLDLVVTQGAADALEKTRAAFPRRVALHPARSAADLAATLATVTNQRLDQRLGALNAKPTAPKTPAA